MVEKPTVALGQFDARHLSLPAEVLETAMQSHQRYFPLVDKKATLSNRFLLREQRRPCLGGADHRRQRAGAAGHA